MQASFRQSLNNYDYLERAEFLNRAVHFDKWCKVWNYCTHRSNQRWYGKRNCKLYHNFSDCYCARFGAVPAGNYNGSYNNFGNNANLWSATEGSATSAWRRSLTYDDAGVYRGSDYGKYRGYSVRCLRD